MAHEFGHFSHYDTTMSMIASVGNLLFNFIIKLVYAVAKVLLWIVRRKDSIFTFVIKIAYNIIMGICKGIGFLGDVILMATSRQHEFMADDFALRSGNGVELLEVLYAIHQVTIDKPERIIEQIRSTHPPITDRIERLEWQLYQQVF